MPSSVLPSPSPSCRPAAPEKQPSSPASWRRTKSQSGSAERSAPWCWTTKAMPTSCFEKQRINKNGTCTFACPILLSIKNQLQSSRCQHGIGSFVLCIARYLVFCLSCFFLLALGFLFPFKDFFATSYTITAWSSRLAPTNISDFQRTSRFVRPFPVQ